MQNERNDREEPNAAHCVYYNDYCYVGNGMKEAMFTKGPWALQEGHYPGFIEIDCGESMKISIVTSATNISLEQCIKRKANAHLIAAAPELYDALTQLIDDLSNTDEEGLFEHSETVIRCRLALSKARGES